MKLNPFTSSERATRGLSVSAKVDRPIALMLALSLAAGTLVSLGLTVAMLHSTASAGLEQMANIARSNTASSRTVQKNVDTAISDLRREWSTAMGIDAACGLVLMLSICVAISVVVHRKFATPLLKMADAVATATSDSLDVVVPGRDGRGEHGVLARALQEVVTSLRDVLSSIDSAAVKLETASREQRVAAQCQAAATADMANTTTELLGSAEQTTSSGASVVEQAELAANECMHGTRSVQDTVKAIGAIHEHVSRMSEHMRDLGGKSQQINGVLDIIAELGEQTNLLSLNASIEAAGAGDAGKRFAVVAGEIRKLAERATDSTTEIRSLVEDIQQTVNATIMATEEGAKIVEQSVSQTTDLEVAFSGIADRVSSTSQSAKAIEIASREQKAAIERLEETVRGIAKAARESEAMSHRLETDSRDLMRVADASSARGTASDTFEQEIAALSR